jgi:hypothetical protein
MACIPGVSPENVAFITTTSSISENVIVPETFESLFGSASTRIVVLSEQDVNEIKIEM